MNPIKSKCVYVASASRQVETAAAFMREIEHLGQARATIYGARADFVFQSTGHALRWLGRVDDVTT